MEKLRIYNLDRGSLFRLVGSEDYLEKFGNKIYKYRKTDGMFAQVECVSDKRFHKEMCTDYGGEDCPFFCIYAGLECEVVDDNSLCSSNRNN